MRPLPNRGKEASPASDQPDFTRKQIVILCFLKIEMKHSALEKCQGGKGSNLCLPEVWGGKIIWAFPRRVDS